ncbi:FkbM family methyltransferase [Telluria mixta]|uniref:FkbM family methyltransferase n=1 Tax=Telluria mixta TaxID=34071 RepID=A0ABT2C1V8_9BURK|nr:FkbM family methyltransferase [Telluria mixta]MCS0630664.1 FkbM family methyltransferase [Telluria mixta]WEM98670.1 FkbM family methyltransferase [Telluria mixta]
MRFISYAQNNEDVLLWRALGHVRDGFYIDVGANDPVEHSVTKAFYDAGWRGINIEPLPAHIAAFDEQRPGDINLAVAAGSAAGTLTLYDVPAVRGWASPDKSVADLHRAEGHTVAELTVPVRTLADVCAEHVRGDVHFLKIDVEGFEGDVLRGMDFERWRPWVLVIEATQPNSRETNHASWEHLVTSRRYRYAWFDGLNRYYVAEEHAELLASFGIQPNVFDDYISHHLDKAWAANGEATAALQAQERELDAARTELHDMIQFAEALELEKQDALALAAQQRHELAQVQMWALDLEQRLTATLNSTSWKVTRPLRMAGALVQRVRRPGLARRLLTRVTKNQRLRRTLIPFLLRHPALNRRVAGMLQAVKGSLPHPVVNIDVPEELRGLPVSVRNVLTDLQRARKHTGG